MAGAPIELANVQRRQNQLETRLRELERANQRLLREALQTSRAPLRPVKTYASTPESYPDPPANCFDIRFFDLELDLWSPGNRTLTDTARSADQQTVAAAADGRFILPDELCWVTWYRRHWWIVIGPGEHYHGRLLGSLSKDGSATMEILKWNGTKYIRTGFEMTVHDRYLNTGKTLAAKTKVDVRLEYPGRYDVVNAYCAADSNADSVYDESPGG